MLLRCWQHLSTLFGPRCHQHHVASSISVRPYPHSSYAAVGPVHSDPARVLLERPHVDPQAPCAQSPSPAPALPPPGASAFPVLTFASSAQWGCHTPWTPVFCANVGNFNHQAESYSSHGAQPARPSHGAIVLHCLLFVPELRCPIKAAQICACLMWGEGVGSCLISSSPPSSAKIDHNCWQPGTCLSHTTRHVSEPHNR